MLKFHCSIVVFVFVWMLTTENCVMRNNCKLWKHSLKPKIDKKTHIKNQIERFKTVAIKAKKVFYLYKCMLSSASSIAN